MGCFQSKKNKDSVSSAGKRKNSEKVERNRKELDVSSEYLFIIREVSANNEESAYPSRIQTHKPL
jgi:hypothetical protein